MPVLNSTDSRIAKDLYSAAIIKISFPNFPT